MMTNLEIAILAITSIFGTGGGLGGLVAFMTNNKKQNKMIRGLGYVGIMIATDYYTQRGYITMRELCDIDNYIYGPYTSSGGNGSAEHMMRTLRKLPQKDNDQCTQQLSLWETGRERS